MFSNIDGSRRSEFFNLQGRFGTYNTVGQSNKGIMTFGFFAFLCLWPHLGGVNLG